MENIKQELFNKLPTVNEIADPNQENDEQLTLSSELEVNGIKYEMCIEILAHKTDIQLSGNYQNDRGDIEGGGTIFVASGITVTAANIFADGEEQTKITTSLIEAYWSITL